MNTKTMNPAPTPATSAPRSRAGTIVGIVLILLGVLSIIGAWGTYRNDVDINESGVRIVGEIIRKDLQPDNPNEYFWIQYRFALPDGQAIEHGWSIDKREWDALQVGGRIPLRYQADNPAHNFPEGRGNRSIGVTMYAIIFGLAFALAGIFLLRSRAD
jgi:hypothetical protein